MNGSGLVRWMSAKTLAEASADSEKHKTLVAGEEECIAKVQSPSWPAARLAPSAVGEKHYQSPIQIGGRKEQVLSGHVHTD